MTRNIDDVGGQVTGREDAGVGPFTRGRFSFKDTASISWTVTDDPPGDEIEIEATVLVGGPPGPPGPIGPPGVGPTGPAGPTGPSGPPGTGFTVYSFQKTADLLSEPQRNSLTSFSAAGFTTVRHITPMFCKVLTVGQNADYFIISNTGGVGAGPASITVFWNTIVPIGGASDQIVQIGMSASGF